MINRLYIKAEGKTKVSLLALLWLMLMGGLPGSILAVNDNDPPLEITEKLIAPVVLPIEIMGDAGTTETVTVNVPNASGVTGLWMQVHNLSYDNKGSVKVNGGNWIDLSNNSVAVAYPENQIFGIGGGYSTIRITVPLSSGAAVNGTNTIQFRFNGTDNLSMGWRVLQFNFVKSDGTKVIPESEFVEDNPANWAPIRTSTSDLDAGESLWYNAALIEPGTGSIQARCTDCHASDARDLKYFNYSDKSIIERSKFHGLTQTQGEQIASWIRSLDYPAPGRPWNPPYQPGPGLDDKPVEEWSAGAGLEWVLDDDSETWPYLFPNGVSDDVASTKSTLNMRELPLAIQFPDWNRWLPRIHPKDAWGNSFENSEAWQSYLDMVAEVDGVNQADWQLVSAVSEFDSDVSDWRRNANSPGSPQDHADANLGLQSWQITKVWGMMQQYHLEDHGKELYPGLGEERTWFSHARNIFNVAPHISSAPGAHTHGTEALDKFFSHAWYMYQLIINPGNRDPQEHRPVDWKYQFGHIGDYSKHTGLMSGNRLVATYIKMIQMLDNDDGISSDGWYMRHAHPYWFVRSMATAPGQINMGIWGSVPVEEHNKVAEVMLRSFLKKSMEYNTSDWPRGEQNWEMEPANYKPQLSTDNGDIFEDRFNYADNFYRIVPEFLDRGVEPSLMDSLANWGESLWPLGDWEDLVDYTDTGGGGGDLPVVTVSTDGNNNVAQEPGGSGNKGKFVISRSGSTSQPLNVYVSFTGTALKGTDYQDVSSPVVLGAGESEVAVHIDPLDDGKNESDESVILTVQSNSNYTIGSGENTAIVTIEDNDGGEAYASGDTTGDGSVSALDAALVLQHVAAIIPLDGVAFLAGDVSGDQNVSAFDASLILQYITGIIDCFPSDGGCAAGKMSLTSSP